MKERPIIFSGEMVRAILEGRKTQTRRVIKPQPEEGDLVGFSFFSGAGAIEFRNYSEGVSQIVKCPYGQPGDRLWVREMWSNLWNPGNDPAIYYRANNDTPREIEKGNEKWLSPIHMPRWASRITLEVVRVQAKRVQEISESDALAEGFPIDEWQKFYAIDWFQTIWNSINAKRGWGWEVNPWVWMVEFTIPSMI